MIDYADLEQRIFRSFVRSNVLSIEEARQHAGLAMDIMRNTMPLRITQNPATLKDMGVEV